VPGFNSLRAAPFSCYADGFSRFLSLPRLAKIVHHERNHQGLGNHLLSGDAPTADPDAAIRWSRRRPRLDRQAPYRNGNNCFQNMAAVEAMQLAFDEDNEPGDGDGFSSVG
jgi:hypothetical protein